MVLLQSIRGISSDKEKLNKIGNLPSVAIVFHRA